MVQCHNAVLGYYVTIMVTREYSIIWQLFPPVYQSVMLYSLISTPSINTFTFFVNIWHWISPLWSPITHQSPTLFLRPFSNILLLNKLGIISNITVPWYFNSYQMSPLNVRCRHGERCCQRWSSSGVKWTIGSGCSRCTPIIYQCTTGTASRSSMASIDRTLLQLLHHIFPSFTSS